MFGGRIDIGAVESQPVGFLPGDYNANGTVDAADYTMWRDTLGSTTDLRADGNGDGVVNTLDYTLWKDNFGQTRRHRVPAEVLPRFSEPVSEVSDEVVPESVASIAAPNTVKADTAKVAGFAIFKARSARRDSGSRPSKRINSFGSAESVGDNLLLTLAIDRVERSSWQDFSVASDRRSDDHPTMTWIARA